MRAMYGNARKILHRAYIPIAGALGALHVEPEMHDIALADDVFLALEA